MDNLVFRRRVVVLIIFLSFFSLSCEGFGEQLMYNKAERLHDEGKIKEAIKIYKKLLDGDPNNKIHPDNANVMYDLSAAYIDIGERRKASDLMKKLEKMGRRDLANMVKKLLYADEMMRK